MTLGQIWLTRWLLSSLLVAGAALFAIGVAAERHATDQHSTESTAQVTQPSTGGTGSGESSTSETATPEAATSESPHLHASTEQVFGINIESTGLVIVACVLSLSLGLLAWRTSGRLVLLIAATFAAIFAALDVTELVHQIGESRAGIATLAALILLVHLASALVAERRAAALRPRAHS